VQNRSTKDDPVITDLPAACADELKAVEFMEKQRWGDNACCPRCGDMNVYKMIDSKTGERQSNFRWRCRGCKEQFTVRIGTVFEDSRAPLRHWCFVFWRAAASKKGEITEELIKSSDFYLKESKEWDKKFTDLKTENETKLKEFENANKEKTTLESVRKKAIELFKGLNPILSEDSAKSERQIEQFVKEVLSGKKFKIEGEGEDMTITILDEKGAPKKDSHGHLVKFEDSIKNTATDLYDFKAAEDRDAPNNDTDKDKPKPGDKKDNKDKKWTGQVPKTQEEYLKVAAELDKKGDNEGIKLLSTAVEQAGVIKFNK